MTSSPDLAGNVRPSPVRQDPLARTLPALARRAAETWGDAPLCVFPDATVTYRDLPGLMDGFAGALQHLGVGPGDRVAVVMSNRSEWMQVWFGIAAAAAIAVPVNFDLKGRLLSHCLADSGSRLAIVEDQYLDEVLAVRDSTPELDTIIVVGAMPDPTAGGPRLLAWDSLERPAPQPREVRLGDPASIMYTSGTTGNAKGVLLPHNYFLHFGEQKALHLRTEASDRIYNVYPMFNATGQCEAVMAAMAVGASVHHAPRFSASSFWSDIKAYGCTEFIYMGGILSILAKAPPSPDDADNDIRAAYGIPTPPELHRAFEERFGVYLVELFGSTESNIVTYNPYDERRVGSCGLPTSGFDVRVVDQDDNDVAPHSPGELITRPNLPFTTMLEYWNNPEQTVRAWRGGWYRTGDLATTDEDGYLYFVGRKAEAIRHKGHMISPVQIEVVILDDEGVLECAVVGIPDRERGEDDIKAVLIRGSESFDLDRVVERCRRELPTWMVPRYWEISSLLPKTPTQKVAKAVLRQEGVTAATVDLLAVP